MSSMDRETAERQQQMVHSANQMFANMPLLAFAKSAETGKYVACNNKFAVYAGKNSPEEVIGLSDFDLFDQETAAHFVADDKIALDNDAPYVFTENTPDAFGKPFYFQTTKLKYVDMSGQLCMLGMSVDVTETMNLQASLAAEQDELKDFRDIMQSARWSVEFAPSGASFKVHWSDDMRHKLGFSDLGDFPDTLDALRNQMQPEDFSYIYKAFIEAAMDPEDAHVFDVEYRIRNKGGEYIWIHSAARFHRSSNGKAVSAVGVFIDVTDTHIKKELYKRLSHNMDIIGGLASEYTGLYRYDVETGNFTVYAVSDRIADTKALLAANMSYEECFRIFVDKAVHPDDQSKLLGLGQREIIYKALRHQKKLSVLFRRNYGGKYLWSEMVMVKVEDADQEPKTVIIGFIEKDNEIRHQAEMQQKEQAYKNAIISSSVGYMEVNLSRGVIEQDVYANYGGGKPVIVEIPGLQKPYAFSDFISWWASSMSARDRETFMNVSNTRYLISEHQRGQYYVEVQCRNKFNSEQERDLRVAYFLTHNNATDNIMALCVLYDMTDINENKMQVAKLTEELSTSRVRNSIGQMQPHFLYNALGSIREIILDDPQYASDLVYDFTTHLRACIKAMSNNDLIPFEQEIINIKAYVNIEQMRFGDKLKVLYDIKKSDFKIVPLSNSN